jgi:thiamine-monophosphate kinase
VGDDAALLEGGRLLCCDALAEGVHFRWDWSSPQDVGWKVVAANVADVLAMGGLPDAAVWSVGMGAAWDDATFAALAEGALSACKTFGCSLVGGDTVRTQGAGFVSLSLLGTLRAARPWIRSGVRPGDRLVLVGTAGLSAAGLSALESGLGSEPDWAPLVEAHRRPRPPLEAVRELFGEDVHAAIDLSDGLSSEAAHLSEASDVALVLDESSLEPTPEQLGLSARLGRDPMDWILHGGEDHSLLMAVSAHTPLPRTVRAIGVAKSGSGVFLERGTARVPLAPGGWSHR